MWLAFYYGECIAKQRDFLVVSFFFLRVFSVSDNDSAVFVV
ncbi:hypothetical protein CPter291_4190 [Collimonas pratensis]|uniref:Uncharacterized protein n=1 Tax=Collimonas pratensis TaxID=279113 RepID=A0ABN4MFM5_9BURK|nr:hypothetical protein CPter291_4190 [Collimonas pratensis]